MWKLIQEGRNDFFLGHAKLIKNNRSNHLYHLNKISYDNSLVLGDPNLELKDNRLNDFSTANNLKSLNKEPARFKTQTTHHVIDLFIINFARYFQNASTTGTGISDFYRLFVTVLKVFYKKQNPKIIKYKNYKTFNEQLGKLKLDKELAKIDLNNTELAEFCDEFFSTNVLPYNVNTFEPIIPSI